MTNLWKEILFAVVAIASGSFAISLVAPLIVTILATVSMVILCSIWTQWCFSEEKRAKKDYERMMKEMVKD